MDDPQLFVVRVWQDASRFRASVRAADETLPRLFSAPEELVLFLARAAQRSTEAPNTPAPPSTSLPDGGT